MKKLLFLFLTLTVNCSLFTDPRLFGGQACLWASSPNTISYQGRLRESGQPVSGIRNIQFKLFDASSAGTEVFNSGAQAIYVSSGIFGYQLGGQNFKDLSWATSSYWLEISVGGNAMSPREQINAMPYAFMASTAASLNGAGNIRITGTGPHYVLNGNVGIGTIAPNGVAVSYSGSVLDIGGGSSRGVLRLGSSSAGSHYIFINNNEATGTTMSIGALGRENTLVLHNGGKVGIGVTNPAGLFQVGGGSLTVLQNGNVGIGTTNPITKLQITGNTKANPDSTLVTLGSDDSSNPFNFYIRRSAGGTDAYYGIQAVEEGVSYRTIVFQQNGGNIGIGTINPGARLHILTTAGIVETVEHYGNGTVTAISFRQGNPSAQVGSITMTGGTQTAYNTTSDLRLKENISDTAFGLETLMKIKVRDFNFIADRNHRMQGYIAQELYDVYPYAVTAGDKNADSSPWSVDYGRLTPLIVKSIQDINSRIPVLLNSIKELESKIEINIGQINLLEEKNTKLETHIKMLEEKNK